jgi:hypothetical protein
MTAEELGKVREYYVDWASEELQKWDFSDYYKQICSLRDKYNATDKEIWVSWVNEKRDGKTYRVAYPDINESFFALSSTDGFMVSDGYFKNPYSVLFSLSCHALEGENGKMSSSAAYKFFDRGLGLYLGYDKEVAFETASPASSYFFEGLLKGYTFNNVLINTPPEYLRDRYAPGATLHALTNDNLESQSFKELFLMPTYTNKIDNQTATEEFYDKHAITVSGIMSTIDPNAISKGFFYGTNENNLLDDNPADMVIKAINPYYKGNYLISAKLKNLEPGKTYFYRAYTYDGIHYNLGEIYSFTIPEASTPYHDLCPDGNHPHMIDLGLPSGTKWSCCNVGASVPTAYGNYYAWGETSTKSTYTKENYKYHHTDSDGKYVYDDATFTMAPTPDQVKELFANCTATETSVDGVAGEKLTSKKNGKKIFLPYGGAKGTSTVGVGEEYQYWTSQLEKSASNSKLLAPRQYSDNETDDLGNPYAFDWYEKDFRYIGKTVRKASK